MPINVAFRLYEIKGIKVKNTLKLNNSSTEKCLIQYIAFELTFRNTSLARIWFEDHAVCIQVHAGLPDDYAAAVLKKTNGFFLNSLMIRYFSCNWFC
jgi:hypothetical protein